MSHLCDSPEAVLPHLRGIEKQLAKTPEQATAYESEIYKLEADYAVAYTVPHYIVKHNGKKTRAVKLFLPIPKASSPWPCLEFIAASFQEYAIAFSSHIRAMFYQVQLLPSDRPQSQPARGGCLGYRPRHKLQRRERVLQQSLTALYLKLQDQLASQLI